jgi:probable rRNA maturation factor
MILVDPDLSPHLLPLKAAKQSAATDPPRRHRLPTTVTLSRFLNLAQAAVRLKGQVTVLLTTDPAIRKLNRQFRGKNKATDVLSFPSEGLMPGLPAHLQAAGDLAISVPTALKQALEQDHSLATEVKVLMLHGLLHLSGLDHETDSGQMARRERLLRGKLKLPQGLIERVEAVALKGRGLSRAAKTPRKRVALAAAGRSSTEKASPQGLKPRTSVGGIGTAEAVPFQSRGVIKSSPIEEAKPSVAGRSRFSAAKGARV